MDCDPPLGGQSVRKLAPIEKLPREIRQLILIVLLPEWLAEIAKFEYTNSDKSADLEAVWIFFGNLLSFINNANAIAVASCVLAIDVQYLVDRSTNRVVREMSLLRRKFGDANLIFHALRRAGRPQGERIHAVAQLTLFAEQKMRLRNMRTSLANDLDRALLKLRTARIHKERLLYGARLGCQVSCKRRKAEDGNPCVVYTKLVRPNAGRPTRMIMFKPEPSVIITAKPEVKPDGSDLTDRQIVPFMEHVSKDTHSIDNLDLAKDVTTAKRSIAKTKPRKKISCVSPSERLRLRKAAMVKTNNKNKPACRRIPKPFIALLSIQIVVHLFICYGLIVDDRTEKPLIVFATILFGMVLYKYHAGQMMEGSAQQDR